MKDNSVFDPLDKYISELSSYPVRSYHPSSASCVIGKQVVGECLRKQYWRWKQEPMDGDMTYRGWLSAQLGSAYEKAFLQGYRAQGLLKTANYPFQVTIMGLLISGRLDGLTKQNEIIECKSAYGKAFYYAVGKKPNPEHLCQIMVYLGCLGLDVCILPYGSRDDTGKRQGYRLRKKDIEAEGILFIKIMDRWKHLKFCLEMNELPERDYTSENWQCHYCGYRKLCYRKPKDLECVL